ncbi:MAG: peptidylprolyl isomerase [Truepera sp.]|nr:peptidylprolyl isomerase [Truepera sp.]
MARNISVALTVALLLGGLWLGTRAQTQAPEPAAPALDIPAGFSLTPFLSDEPVRQFTEAQSVLLPDTDYAAVIDTSRGRLVIDLFEQTPITVNSLVFLARHRYFDGIVFHRVLDGFMAQTGDPTGTGRGGPGYQFEDEIVPGLVHDQKGVVSMANAGPNTNGSQFFITFAATPWLDGRHTVFGRVVEGLEVLDALTRIDPQTPSIIAFLTDSLASLAEQGVLLAGEADQTLQSYLSESLGVMPAAGQTFTVDGFTGVLGRLGDTPAIGFFPQPDVIERMFIIERPASSQ